MLPQLMQGGGDQGGGGSPSAGQIPQPQIPQLPQGGSGDAPVELPRFRDMPLGEPSLQERTANGSSPLASGSPALNGGGANDVQPIGASAGEVINDPLAPGDPAPLAEPGLVEDELTASLDALANSDRGRQALRGSVRGNPDGSFDVTLPGETPVNVTPEEGGAKGALEAALKGKRRARGNGSGSPLGALIGKPTKVYLIKDLSESEIEKYLRRSIEEDAPAILRTKKRLPEEADDLSLLAKTTYSLEGKEKPAPAPQAKPEPEPEVDDLDDWDKEDWEERKIPVTGDASHDKQAKPIDEPAKQEGPLRFRLKSPLEQTQPSRALTAKDIKAYFYKLEVVEW